MSMSDSSLRWTIQEWMPPFFSLSFSFWLLALFSSLFVYRYWKKLNLLMVAFYIVCFLAALSSSRHIPFFVLIALPLTMQSLALFQLEVHHIPQGRMRLKKVFLGLCVVSFLLCTPDIWRLFIASSDLPSQKSVVYLKEHMTRGEIFAPYGWGGYLLWQVPGKKVFIDGRMPSWRRAIAPTGESSNAFKEYQQFLAGQVSFARTVEYYHITTIILPVTQPPIPGSLIDAYLTWGNKTLGLSLPESVLFARLRERVERAGWKRVYQDNEVRIYRRITP